MSKKFAWSYSALTGFETCPRQYYQMRLVKPCPWEDPPGEVQQWGIDVHKMIENRIGMGKPLPSYLGYVEPIIQKLEVTKGAIQPEYRMALDASFQPVEFFDKKAWVRAVGDVVKVHGDKALAMDWKCGKYREGDGQLKLQSAVMFANYPQLQNIAIVYAWLKDKRTTVRQFKREDAGVIWGEFLPRVRKMEQAIIDEEFPPIPSGLCGRFCPVLSCQHNGRSK